MARNKCIVYLGYEDDYINEKNKSLVDFTTNKIGGQPVRRKENISFVLHIFRSFNNLFFICRIFLIPI